MRFAFSVGVSGTCVDGVYRVVSCSSMNVVAVDGGGSTAISVAIVDIQGSGSEAIVIVCSAAIVAGVINTTVIVFVDFILVIAIVNIVVAVIVLVVYILLVTVIDIFVITVSEIRTVANIMVVLAIKLLIVLVCIAMTIGAGFDYFASVTVVR